MNTRSQLRALFLVALAVLIAAASPKVASAQQVTYYDFDAVGASNFSIACSAANNGPDILFCFNSASSPVTFYPSLLPNSPYPASVDPNPAENPVASQHTSLQVTNGGSGEYSSAWFAVPQKVRDGFSVYSAFRLTGSGGGDGMAFVIQNASGGGTDVNDPIDGDCVAAGSGLNISATIGACLGYGAIDNSVAVEFDTYRNGAQEQDTDNFMDPIGNHIAIKSCGLSDGAPPIHGLPNSPNHSRCNVGPIASPGTFLDGNVHQVVIEYFGPNETPANTWNVYLDPPFVPGTHTPVTGTIPTVTTVADISGLMTLQNSGSGNDSAYVGFTGASGGATSSQEILAWTYTPHTPATAQPTPIGNGTPTTFPFGAHTYAATYPAGTPDTAGTDMVVIATTIPQNPDFTSLVANTSYAGSQCQVYEGTGGNCIIYSVYCVTHSTNNKVACPSTSDPVIAVKTAYESDNSLPPPTSPGFLHGDPFYSPVTSIQGLGATATVSCTGSCSVTDGETVSIRGNSVLGLNAENVMVSASTVDTFTYPLAVPNSSSGTGGFVTSGNFTDICDTGEVTPDNPPCWQAAKIDGTTSGKTKNFSDLAALSTTVFIVGTNTAIAPPAAITYGQTASITVSVSPTTGSTPVSGSVSLTVGGTPAGTQNLSSGATTFSVAGLNANPAGYALVATYTPDAGFATSTGNGTLVVNKATPSVTWTPAPLQLGFPLTTSQ
ncbi:MAG TPA: Ig-like domain repeat protein, partial [Terriglobales bacterium]|nr:Ig-like domain repeat protein [Terriglobales bacterium]